MALQANINRDSKAKPEPYSAFDFMNFIDRPPEPELNEEELQDMIDREIFGL